MASRTKMPPVERPTHNTWPMDNSRQHPTTCWATTMFRLKCQNSRCPDQPLLLPMAHMALHRLDSALCYFLIAVLVFSCMIPPSSYLNPLLFCHPPTLHTALCSLWRVLFFQVTSIRIHSPTPSLLTHHGWHRASTGHVHCHLNTLYARTSPLFPDTMIPMHPQKALSILGHHA